MNINTPVLKRHRSSLFRISKSRKLPSDFFKQSRETTQRVLSQPKGHIESSQAKATPYFGSYRTAEGTKREHLRTQTSRDNIANHCKEMIKGQNMFQCTSLGHLNSKENLLKTKKKSSRKEDFKKLIIENFQKQSKAHRQFQPTKMLNIQVL